jgi:hypothetical protein
MYNCFDKLSSGSHSLCIFREKNLAKDEVKLLLTQIRAKDQVRRLSRPRALQANICVIFLVKSYCVLYNRPMRYILQAIEDAVRHGREELSRSEARAREELARVEAKGKQASARHAHCPLAHRGWPTSCPQWRRRLPCF